MRKLIYIVSIISLLSSCSDGVEKSIEIKDFTSIIKDSLIPKKNINYTASFIEISGFVDDSICINEGVYKKYISGKIDTTFRSDYYGEYPAQFVLNPYKAKKGNLKVKFRIN